MGRPIDRREFVKTMGAAGALGAMTPAAGAAQAAQAGGVSEFPRPANLRPARSSTRASRSASRRPCREGLRLVTEYFTALSQREPGRARADAALPVRDLREHRADRRRERRGSARQPAADAERHRQGQVADQARLVRPAREHERAPLLPGRRRVLAVVHALHARRSQAARVRRHLLGHEQRRALGDPAGVDDLSRGGLPRRRLSRRRAGRHPRQPELPGGVRLRQRGHPQRSEDEPRVVRSAAAGRHTRRRA